MNASIRWTTVTIDAADAAAVASFYSRLLGWPITDDDGGGWYQLSDPDGGVGLNVQTEADHRPPVWPDRPDAQAKMLHLEVMVDDLEAAIALVVDAGGSVAPHQPPDRDPSRLRVVLDPAGHPLCLFVDGE